MDYPRECKVQLESPDVYPQQMDLSAGNVENANLNISTQAHQDFKFQSSGHQHINLAIMSPYEFTSKTHSLSTEDLGKIFIH